MKLYENQDVVGADLLIGDLLRSKRGFYSLLVCIGDSLTVLTEAGCCCNISRDQANTGTRLANTDLSALRFDNVFNEEFVPGLVQAYHNETSKRDLVAQLAYIPAEVLEAALEARRNQNLIHSRSPKA